MYKQILLVTSCLLGISVSGAFAGLEEEIEDVKNYAGLSHKVSLALGVSDKEKNLDIKFDQTWVFLDDTMSGALKGRHLEVNFNKEDQLDTLARGLPGQFNKIVLDTNVYKFTNWTLEHLESFKKTLQDGGTFQFQPDYFCNLEEQSVDHNQLMANLSAQMDDTKLECKFVFPSSYPIKEGEYEDEIKREVEKRKQNAERVKDYATNMDLMQFQRKCMELGIKSEDSPPHHILQASDPTKLERYFNGLEQRLAQEINKKHFCDKFFAEVVLPHNEMVLKKVFSKVELKKNVEYPIPSSTGAPIEIDFFVCRQNRPEVV